MADFTRGTKLKKLVTGTESGTWGDSTNTNWDRVDFIVGGYSTFQIPDGTDQTLSLSDNWTIDGTDYLAAKFLEITCTSTVASGGNWDIILDPNTIERSMFIWNNTTAASGSTITIKTSGGAGSSTTVVIPYLEARLIYTDGTGSVQTANDFANTFNGAVALLGDVTINGDYPTGTENSVIGEGAGSSLESGSGYNVIFGSSAGADLSTGDSNVMIGWEAGNNQTTDDNVIIGYKAGHTAGAGGLNVLIGYKAGESGPAGSSNVAIGPFALDGETAAGGQNNVAIGNGAMGVSDGAAFNTAVGPSVCSRLTSADYNAAFGWSAGDTITGGEKNTLIGPLADTSANADLCVSLGYYAGKNSTGDSKLNIHSSTSAVADGKSLIYGDFATGYVTVNGTGNATTFKVDNSQSSLSSSVALTEIKAVDASDGTAWSFLKCIEDSGSSADVMFRLDGNGTGHAVAWTADLSGDYADYFEWADGNSSGEDRVGYSVILENGMISKATDSDDPKDIIGIVSGIPTAVGNASWSGWHDRYVRDDFGRTVTESVDFVSWDETTVTDLAGRIEGGPGETGRLGHHEYRVSEVPDGLAVPDDALYFSRNTHIKNPVFDPSREYVSRESRPEWSPVGLTGRIPLRKGQPTNPSWRKIRDVSSDVEEWLVR